MLGACLVAGVGSAGAQGPSVSTSHPPRAPSNERTLLRGVAEPASFQVVAVDVPADLHATNDLRFVVEGLASTRIVSAQAGTLPPRPREQRLLLTLQVPADAEAGRRPLARITFSAAGVQRTVDVEVEVARIARTLVEASRITQGIASGQTQDVWFEVRNLGNAADTLTLSLNAPPFWDVALSGPAMMVVETGQTTSHAVRVSVPAAVRAGSGAVSLTVSRHGTEHARGQVIVEVTAPQADRRLGPVATASVVALRDGNGVTSVVGMVGVTGAVMPGLHLDAYTARPTSDRRTATETAAQLAYPLAPSHLRLAAKRWAVALGATGTLASDLTGQMVAGSGAMMQWDRDSSRLRMLWARPLQVERIGSEAPAQYLAALDGQRGAVNWSASAVRMQDPVIPERRLDAVSIRGGLRPLPGLNLSAELADRRFAGGRGVGASGTLRYARKSSLLDVHLLHAPGGADAFAQASSGFFAVGSQTVGSRLRLGANVWSTADASAVLSSVRSAGWAFSPSYRLLPGLALGLDVRGSDLASTSAAGGLTNGQRQVAINASLRHGGWRFAADVMSSNIARGVTTPEGAAVRRDGRRASLRSSASHESARGTIGVTFALDGAAPDMPAQGTSSLHVDRFRPIGGWSRLTLDASLQQVRFAGETLRLLRAAANLDLGADTRLRVAVQQDGFGRSMTGSAQTRMLVGIQRGLAVPVPDLARRTGGMVFEDLNANGLRDPGEAGLAGAVVRAGTETATSDVEGRFRFSTMLNAPLELDVRSLPNGWLPSKPTARLAGTGEIGVVPTARANVQVVLAEGLIGVRLGPVTVVMRDANGQEWMAVTDAAGSVLFDALPVGQYTITASADQSSEPLLLDPQQPLNLATPARSARLTITARTRPIKLLQSKTPGARP